MCHSSLDAGYFNDHFKNTIILKIQTAVTQLLKFG